MVKYLSIGIIIILLPFTGLNQHSVASLAKNINNAYRNHGGLSISGDLEFQFRDSLLELMRLEWIPDLIVNNPELDKFHMRTGKGNLKGKELLYSFINQIQVSVTDDNSLAIVSYDVSADGSDHAYVNIAQFRHKDSLKAQVFDSQIDWHYAGYYGVSRIHNDQSEIYITTGYGTHGLGLHHFVISGWELEGDTLKEFNYCLPKNQRLIIETKRYLEPQLIYNRVKKEISFTKFSELGIDAEAPDYHLIKMNRRYVLNYGEFVQVE